MKRHILIATLAVATPMAFASIAAAQTKLPAEIEAAGETAFLTLHAEGAQVYECKEKDGKLGWGGARADRDPDSRWQDRGLARRRPGVGSHRW